MEDVRTIIEFWNDMLFTGASFDEDTTDCVERALCEYRKSDIEESIVKYTEEVSDSGKWGKRDVDLIRFLNGDSDYSITRYMVD